jgi:hypothetical protein
MFDLTNDVIEELRASKRWTDRFRDRGSELVFIGTKLDKKHMFKELHNALLTDAELNVPEDTRKKVCASDMTISSIACRCGNWRTYREKKTEKICDVDESEE